MAARMQIAAAPALRYFRTRDELRRLEEVDRRVFRDRDNWLRLDDAIGWARVYSRSVVALIQDEEVLGYAKCLPLEPNAFAAAIAGPGDLRDFLVARNLLTDAQAIGRAKDKGNVVY